MFYINNKKVKEWIVKGEGNDQFLHRVRSAVMDNREFYSGNSSNSEFVDIKVYHEGQRIKTSPQFVKKTELSSTIIRVQLLVDYNLMVPNASKNNVVDFSGAAGSNPTFKLDPSTTASTVYVYLREASPWRNTYSYSLLMIHDDNDPSSISTSSIGKDCGFNNAQCYVYNGYDYSVRALEGLAIIAPAAHATSAYLSYNFIDPPELSVGNSYNQAEIRFGYLPKETAEAMGFTAEENPNGEKKETTDYYGWGCWVDNEAWLWSDDELREIFSTDGSTIEATSNWKGLITLAKMLVYHLYGSNIASIIGGVDPVFEAGFIFEHDGESMVSEVRLLQDTPLSTVIQAYDGTYDLILILPFSQGTLDDHNKMSDFYEELLNSSILVEDLPTSVDQFFNINSVLPNSIAGTITVSVRDYVDNGYLYCGSNIQDDINVATQSNSVTLTLDSSTSIIYLGNRTPSTSLTISLNDITMPDWMSEMMMTTNYFNYYKLIPFITSPSIGPAYTDGAIELSQ